VSFAGLQGTHHVMSRQALQLIACVACYLLLLIAGTPATALAAGSGCEVLKDAVDRARCEVRAEARDAARAEVQRASQDAAPRSAGASSPAWDAALASAEGPDWRTLLQPRPIAAIGGLVWFLLVLRHRRRAVRRGA